MGINGNEDHHQSSTDQRTQSDDTSLHQEIEFPSTQPRWSNSSRYAYVFQSYDTLYINTFMYNTRNLL